MLSLIIAYSNNNIIGVNQKLPWKRLNDDLAMFKIITSHKPIVMGRKTFDSLPTILPNRKHYVLTTQNLKSDNEQVEYINSIQKVLEIAKTTEIIVIGGEALISLFAPYYQRLYLTKVDLTIEPLTNDVSYMPLKQLNLETYSKVLELTKKQDEKNCANFKFTIYERKK